MKATLPEPEIVTRKGKPVSVIIPIKTKEGLTSTAVETADRFRPRRLSMSEVFERLGAGPWADRARSELRASGETATRRDPVASAALTPQELQVARYVQQGFTNKEVAAQLFLSPRTIDAHLRNVFGKLGITARSQLRGMPLGAPDEAPVPEPEPAALLALGLGALARVGRRRR